MKFSIVIPVYNAELYLCECLDSVLAQKFGDWEAICVDDGSTDDSWKILNIYANRDKRIKVIRQDNVGPGGARNAGIEMARGEWLSFIDADDRVDADYLSAFAGIPEVADINFFSVCYEYGDGSRKIVSTESNGVVSDNGEMFRLLSLMAWNEAGCHYLGFSVNKFYRADLIRENQVRFPDSLKICEDEIFLFKCLEFCKSIRVDSRAPYVYKWRKSGLTCRVIPPFLDAALCYRELAIKTSRVLINKLAERRVAECCDWHVSRGAVSFKDACRMVDLLKIHFENGSNRFPRLFSRLMRLSMLFSKIYYYYRVRRRPTPPVQIDWNDLSRRFVYA